MCPYLGHGRSGDETSTNIYIVLCKSNPLSVKEKINIELANQKQEAMSFLESDGPIPFFLH